MKCQNLFSGKIWRIFQCVVCCKINPECKGLSLLSDRICCMYVDIECLNYCLRFTTVRTNSAADKLIIFATKVGFYFS